MTRSPQVMSGEVPSSGAIYGWRVLSVTGIGMTLAFLDASTLPVALPAIGRHYAAGSVQASWVVLAYLLATTSLILMFGRLADRYGRKRLYLFGMVVITIASTACGFAPTIEFMIAMRVLQGVGGAAILANTTALLTDAFSPRLLPVGLSLNVTLASTSSVLGPLISGALVSTVGWRAIFWVNLPVGVLGTVWAVRTLRSDRSATNPRRVDVRGAILAAAVLAAMAYVLDRGADVGWTSPSVVVVLAVGVVAAATLYGTERHAADPLIDPILFRYRPRTMAYLATSLMSVSQSSVTLLMSLYLQSVQAQDAWHAGLRITPYAAGILVASPIAGRLARRVQPRILSSTGFALSAVSLLSLSMLLRQDTGRATLGVILVLLGIGIGLFQAPNTSALMSTVPDHIRSIASAVRSTLQASAQVLSAALSLSIVAAAAPDNRAAMFAGNGNSAADRLHLVSGFRTAFVVLAAISITGVTVSLLRGASEHPRRRDLDG